jgi:hypothetical protein
MVIARDRFGLLNLYFYQFLYENFIDFSVELYYRI